MPKHTLFLLTRNNYMDMGLMSDAEVMYNTAFRMMPNRLYPLYKLMLLYKKMNQMEKVENMAERIVAFKVKIESNATKEIKNKAKAELQYE